MSQLSFAWFEVEKTTASYRFSQKVDKGGGAIQGARGTSRFPKRYSPCDAGDGTYWNVPEKVELAKEYGSLAADKEQEYYSVTLIRYGQQDWMLSNWAYTYGKKMSQRIWLCPKGKTSAITIVRNNEGKYSFIVQSPDGEILDVGVCQQRHEAKKISHNVLKQFLEHCEIRITQAEESFRSWIL